MAYSQHRNPNTANTVLLKNLPRWRADNIRPYADVPHRTRCETPPLFIVFINKRQSFIEIKYWSFVYRRIIMDIASFRAAPHNSARDSSERFCPKIKFGKRRNTGCISSFSNCKIGAKDPLLSADAIVRCCLRGKKSRKEGFL